MLRDLSWEQGCKLLEGTLKLAGCKARFSIILLHITREPSIYELDSKAVDDLQKAAADVKEAAPEQPKNK